MMRVLQIGSLLVAVLLAGVAGWRIVVTSTADRLAEEAPQRAIRWDAHDPAPLLQLASERLAKGESKIAAATAREVLRIAPLQAEAFVLLARAADAMHAAGARALFDIAVRRAPRDQYARAWMIGTQLNDADYSAALANIDKLLRFASPRSEIFVPIMVQLADKPAFATALVHTLLGNPPWRNELLSQLLSKGSHAAADAVYSSLQSQHGLNEAETGAWLARLMQAGIWGEAYSRWASGLQLPPGTALPLIHDGGFEAPATGIGFDWRIPGAPGVLIEPVMTADGRAEQVTFMGRRAPEINFAQTLMLAPGAYRLKFRARSLDVRSDKGIEWAVSCHGSEAPLATSESMQATFDWKTLDLTFVVPPEECPAQELALINPGADGSGKIVSGTLWFDDFTLTPVANPEAEPEPVPADKPGAASD